MIPLESTQVYGQPEKKGCWRCDGEGRIRAAEPRMWIEVEATFLNMLPGEDRACAIKKIYREWTIDGCVDCPECKSGR